MDLGSPETWRWIWFVAAVAFAGGELATPGAFFMAPFAAGAGAAALVSLAGLSPTLSWVVFLAVSVTVFAALRPIAQRLQRRSSPAVSGASRWVSREAIVTQEIGGAESNGRGRVRLDREEWTAESFSGERLPVGTKVVVNRVEGTRLVVMPLELPGLGWPQIEQENN